MPKFFNHDIADLAHQLTISPRRLRMGQLHGIELLLELVEEDKAYPFDFVCYHVTRYRKRGSSTGPSIPGKALIADLVAMAELISLKANLTAAELDEPIKTHQEVADELQVSLKTIRRWRNRGLLGIHIVSEAGAHRLAFCKSTVDRFVVRHKDMVSRGAAFKQLSPDERGRIIQRAVELLEQRPMKLHAVVRAIAEETGRAVETVRYTLRRHDESGAAPLLPQTGPDTLCERYQAVWRCHQAGEAVASIARAFECGPDEIHRIVRHVQVVMWRQTPPICIHNELFDAPGAEAIILGAPEPPASNAKPTKAPADTPGYLRALYLTPLLTVEQERDLFRRYNYAKHQTARLLDAVNPEAITEQDFATLQRGMARIDDFKQRITQANLRLVVSITRKHVGWSPAFFEVVSDGNMSLMRAIEKFDYGRGVRFSTYATWAIVKNYARSIPAQHYRAARWVTGQNELLDEAADHRKEPVSESDRTHIRELISAALATLSQREQDIVSGHFGLGRLGAGVTLEQLGKRLGVTKERVRQIEKRALAQMREMLSPSIADILPD